VSKIKQKIRAASDLARELVEVPEWDVTIEVRSMSARQRSLFAATIESGQNETDVTQRLERLWSSVFLTCLFDPETNEPLFGDEDMDWLFVEKSGVVIDRIANVCLEVSGLKEKAVDEAGKSSLDSLIVMGESTPSDDSTSI
jgi:hypothetical protein